MSDFFVEIIARDEKVYTGKANYLLLPGWDGETGILANHAPLISMLKPGICILRNGEKEHVWALAEGFASIADNKINIAVVFAYRAEEIDENEAEKTLNQAQKELDLKGRYEDTDEDYMVFLRAKACMKLIERK